MTKEWYKNWLNKDWVTAEGTPVKNRDMWEAAIELLGGIEAQKIELPMYHIKGHLVKITKAQGRRFLEADANGYTLYEFAKTAAEKLVVDNSDETYLKALETFEKNHGFIPEPNVLVELIACNTVADVMAGVVIDNIEK
ncbi:Ribonuclease H [compost metagenome]